MVEGKKQKDKKIRKQIQNLRKTVEQNNLNKNNSGISKNITMNCDTPINKKAKLVENDPCKKENTLQEVFQTKKEKDKLKRKEKQLNKLKRKKTQEIKELSIEKEDYPIIEERKFVIEEDCPTTKEDHSLKEEANSTGEEYPVIKEKKTNTIDNVNILGIMMSGIKTISEKLRERSAL